MTVTAIVVAYDDGDVLQRCVDALRADGVDVVVVNNGGPVDVTGARVVEAGRNLGFGGGCNLGAASTDAGVLVFVNPDAVVRPGAVAALARRLEDTEIGVAQARLRLLDEPELLNSAGNVVHLSGLAWPGGYRDHADSVDAVRDVAYASGAAFAIRAETFDRVGGFTEELFLYQEDLELSWRARLAGLRVVVEPEADVLHDYVLERGDRRKEYYLERNRLVFLLTAYSGRLLALLAPVILCIEAGIVVLAARDGWWREKARGWLWLARNVPWLVERRRRTQALRVVADRELARYLTPTLDPRMLELPRNVAVVNAVVAAWWRGARVLL
ncbi:MAG TPA: glycosyltransferase family 2 protein [Gaiellaceae bacterium]|nr:glycosyltransferase family 2 protein [Gaiellaceae bacterium]